MDWETGLKGDWGFWRSCWGDFFRQRHHQQEQSSEVVSSLVLLERRRRACIFFLLLWIWNSVRKEVRDERDTENTNDEEGTIVIQGSTRKGERESQSSKTNKQKIV